MAAHVEALDRLGGDDPSSSASTPEAVEAAAPAAAAAAEAAAPLIKEMGALDVTGRERFTFDPVAFAPAAFTEREGKDRLLRWGLGKTLRVQRYHFNGVFPVDGSAMPALLADLFSGAAELRAVLPAPPAELLPGALRASRVKATALSVEPFDALKSDDGPCTENGYIRKCADEDCDGILAQDMLRLMMLRPDESEYACLLSEGFKAEFLFHVFRLLVVGGAMAQPDDYVTDYIAATRQLYKELLSVYRATKTGKIEIGTLVFQLDGFDKERAPPGASDACLYAERDSPHNRCYVLVEPRRKLVTVLYSPYAPFW